MERIVIDAELAAKLRQLTRPAELVDPAGAFVAVVPPTEEPYSQEEIEDRCAPERARFTAEEIVAKLRELS